MSSLKRAVVDPFYRIAAGRGPVHPGRKVIRLLLTISVVSVIMSLSNRRREIIKADYRAVLPSITPVIPARGNSSTTIPVFNGTASLFNVTVKPTSNQRDPEYIYVSNKSYFLPYTSANSTNFTVIMLTHKRDSIVFRTLRHYYSMSAVSDIVLYINEATNTTPIDIKIKEEGLAGKVRTIGLPGNDLMERFKPTPQLKTDAVFSVDDDILVDSKKMMAAFKLWKVNARSIVGFPFRLHETKGNRTYYQYKPERSYSMVLTGAAFYHRTYQHVISETLPPEVLARVRAWVNCEDIAFNIHVSAYCNCDPVMAVRPRTLKMKPYIHLSKARYSLSGRKSHGKARSLCVEYFSKSYDKMPLKVKKIFYVVK